MKSQQYYESQMQHYQRVIRALEAKVLELQEEIEALLEMLEKKPQSQSKIN